MKPIRVLVVDDSRSMRLMIAAALAKDPDIVVAGEAADPFEARDAIKALSPDVVTLDVEMPRMDGLAFLERLMRLRPTPVIMVSSLTGPQCDKTLEALELGAVDCVAKPVPGEGAPFADLADKVRAAATARMAPRRPRVSPAAPKPSEGSIHDGRIVAIGSSTGGVEALCEVIAGFPAGCPPTVITQHMPEHFTKSLAARLDRLGGARVEEAWDGAVLEPGRVYLAPGGGSHLTVSNRVRPVCRLVPADPVNGHRPSVDVLFGSVARAVGADALGVILTGMGRDGADGLLAMRRAGARTLGQDEETSLIYGMPRVAQEVGAVERQVPLSRIASAILASTLRRAP